MAVTIEKIGKVSSASVLKGTGKSWDHWIAVITKAGGAALTHKEMVAFLKRKRFKLSLWWQQGLATGFEMHIGRKVEGRNSKGEYSTVASRTFPLTQKNFWTFLESAAGQSLWLNAMSGLKFKPGCAFEVEGGIFGELRTMKKPERLRLRWQDEEWAKPSVISIAILWRPGPKCILVFQHDQLPNAKARASYNAHWKKVLDDIQKALA